MHRLQGQACRRPHGPLTSSHGYRGPACRGLPPSLQADLVTFWPVGLCRRRRPPTTGLDRPPAWAWNASPTIGRRSSSSPSSRVRCGSPSCARPSPGVTAQVLTRSLRALGRDGIVVRRWPLLSVYSDPHGPTCRQAIVCDLEMVRVVSVGRTRLAGATGSKVIEEQRQPVPRSRTSWASPFPCSVDRALDVREMPSFSWPIYA